MEYLLVLLIAIPLLGAALTPLLYGSAVRSWALLVSLVTAALGVILAYNFNFGIAGDAFRFGHEAGALFSIPQIGFQLALGVDAISLWLTILTVVLTPLAIWFSFGSIVEREKEYYAWMLLLLAAMVGVFIARDLLLFYIFFELTLIPMFFIIGIWGGSQRRYAAAKFFLFTFAGSIFTLAGVLYLGMMADSFAFSEVFRYAQTQATATERFWLLLAFLGGFAVKVPLFPVHTWLPLAHTEAPTAGSVILAGVLLKLGTYGLMAIALPVGLAGLADSTEIVGQFLYWQITIPGFIKFLGVLCVIGIIYGALVAWVQQDIKKLVAYSSVSHLGFCVLGLLALNTIGMQGSVLYMINHGISTGAMFLVIGMIYDRYHTRDIDELSGLAKRMPILAFFFILFTMSSIGLPGTNGFISEFLSILGAFTSDRLGIGFGVFAAMGIVLGAVYMLHMAARVIWGPLKTPDPHAHDPARAAAGEDADTPHAKVHQGPGDINKREIAILVPLAIAVFYLGLYPAPLMRTLEPALNRLTTVATADAAHETAVVTAQPEANQTASDEHAALQQMTEAAQSVAAVITTHASVENRHD